MIIDIWIDIDGKKFQIGSEDEYAGVCAQLHADMHGDGINREFKGAKVITVDYKQRMG